MFSLGNIGGYFSPSKPEPVTTGIGEVSTWNKAKGKVTGLFDTGTKDIGALYGDVDFEDSANDELLGVLADTEGEVAAAKEEKGVDWDAMSRMLQSIKPQQEQQLSHSSRGGGGFRFDRKPYENQLLTREYESLYNQPLYNKLG